MSGGQRPRYGGSRRRAEEERRAKRLAFRVMALALCIITACALKLGDGAGLRALRERAAAVLSSDADYAGAAETLGRAAAGEQPESGESAAAVFGRMLLGLSEDTP